MSSWALEIAILVKSRERTEHSRTTCTASTERDRDDTRMARSKPQLFQGHHTRSLSGLGFRIHSEWISRTILVRREPRIEIRGDRGAGIGPKDARMVRKSFGRRLLDLYRGSHGADEVKRAEFHRVVECEAEAFICILKFLQFIINICIFSMPAVTCRERL